MLNQDLIRERAYMLWLESGGAIGRGDEHWLRAEREMTSAAAPVSAAAKPIPAKRTAKAKVSPAAAAKPRGSRRSAASAA